MKSNIIAIVFLSFWLVGLQSAEFYQLPNGKAPNHLEPDNLWLRRIPEVLRPEQITNLAFYAARPSFADDYSLTLHEKIEWEENPDFQESDEFTFEAEKKRKSLGFFLTFRIVKDETPHVVEVSRALAVELNRLWMKCLLQTAYSKENYRGLDGTDYFFSSGHMQTGYHGVIWSPRVDTFPRSMVEFADSLCEKVEKGMQLSESDEKETISRIHELQMKLNHNQTELSTPFARPSLTTR
ncbi:MULTISPECIES: hypothetical protein [unclassified Lentimonas]|uniref:hypothetical protein n=1 Tax=unclassified Lentimonas TaxID=2630993 RepID=UPI001389591C|nr:MULTISPECIES: hypothetical protein [unclassified Lentimonas]